MPMSLSRRPAALVMVAAVLSAPGALSSATAQPGPSAATSAAVTDDLVAANRILADQGVLDAFGHVSIRHPGNPNRFLMSRSLAPALVKVEDIMEFDLDGNPTDQRGRAVFLERFIHAEPRRGGCDDAGRRRRLALAREEGHDHVAVGQAGRERL